jgi:stage IV sporulation protein A
MVKSEIYKDIKSRTGGDIYLGVVGPVRTGKSTFIKNFMEMFVIPNIENDFKKDRAQDELPQSAGGKTIMTTEPKFVPNESVEIKLDNNIVMKTRLVDCVGYIVEDSLGYLEDDNPRMVKTPWSTEEIPFEKAAEIGTKKVITDHSTIGLVVTTDGSITDIERESYKKAESRVIQELKNINKPFVILLNSKEPESEQTLRLARELEEEYSSAVIPTDVANLTEKDVTTVFEKALNEFPITEVGFELPSWFDILDFNHWMKQDMINIIKNIFDKDYSLREIKYVIKNIQDENNLIKNINVTDTKLEDGSIKVKIEINSDIFYKILSELSKNEILSEYDIFKTIKDYSKIKEEYDKIHMALEEVRIKGYGIVTPQMEELSLEEPEIIKQGNKFGVKLKATAPSIHMIRADIETEVSPIVGSEKQSEDLVKYLLSEFENDPKKIWQSNIFGKSLHELVNEGLQNKLYRMPDEAQMKLQETLERIINEGSGGLICIIL